MSNDSERERETKSTWPVIDDAVEASAPAAIMAPYGQTDQRRRSGGSLALARPWRTESRTWTGLFPLSKAPRAAASASAAIMAPCGRTTQGELSGGVARTPEALAHGVVRRHGSISALEGAVRGGERVGTINSYFS